jgi:hypothetical protein
MREWLETTHNAEKLAFSSELLPIKSFLEKTGTNRLVQNKKVVMEWSRPFDILLKYKGFAEAEGGKDVYKKEGQPTAKVDCPLVSG